ncbi:hypothetical protein OAK92_02870, partial [Crocinitomicaceae bacterium]|nr:hypothetical protein [Crocinitomicaceae bacterium]
IPLLQEYFYGDYSKMEMVIGEKFLKRTKVSDVKFAVQPNDIELDGVIYQIKNPEEMSPQEFITALKVIIPE